MGGGTHGGLSHTAGTEAFPSVRSSWIPDNGVGAQGPGAHRLVGWPVAACTKRFFLNEVTENQRRGHDKLEGGGRNWRQQRRRRVTHKGRSAYSRAA